MLVMAAFVAIASCSDDEKTSTATQLAVLKDSVQIDALNFQVSSGSAIIAVDCDADWTASLTDTSWISISNHAGYGYTDKWSYIKVSVDKNTSDERNTLLTINSGSLSKVITISQNGIGLDPGDPFESAWAFVDNLVLGYNLGNTLDASQDLKTQTWFKPQTVYDWETCWGQPVTTQEIVDAIAAKGFNVIRVPVTWFPHMDSDGNVQTEWMDRVETVVNYVLNTGCYCIVNVMHDSGSRGDRTDSIAWIVADANQYSSISPRYKKLWTQIATRFKGYGEKLLFEAFNEILDENYTWGNPSKASAYETVNKLEQDFVDAVRSTGGNNEYRNLICNPYSAGNSAEKMAGWEPPTDVHPNHILGSVHSYDPYNFCNDNGEWNVETFDASCQEEVDDVIARVAKRYDQTGTPYFYGEFGAIDDGKSMSERIKYAKYVAQQFKSQGTTGLWWMGLFDRTTMTWYESEIVDALFNVMNN